MRIESRYAPLFEPLKIGPVTAPNRFYQVPHCTGMGHALPRTLAAMRGIKAEGGWGVVCTEYCSIHPSSDDHPFPYASIWDDGDIANLAAVADAVHAHGALAGIELWHGGSYVANLASRVPSLGVRSMPCRTDPVQSQRMDRGDIARLRQWHRQAALRARSAGFDIIYVYATHGYLVSEFLSRSLNDRVDEYGGSLWNRTRLYRELLEDTKDAVGDRCAVATRFSANGHGDEHLSGEEAEEVLDTLGPLPDLWDIVVDDYEEEMGSSRFVKEAAFESRVQRARELTGRPVVSVGRFTSPDIMLRQIKSGLVDFIGAARPSIADPFLPTKIREGRIEDIRECIGCNICYAQISAARHCAARRTRRSAKNGARVGTRSGCPPAPAARCSSSVRARRASKPRRYSESAATKSRSRTRRWRPAGASRAKAACPDSLNGRACATIASAKSSACRMSRSISTAACKRPTCAIRCRSRTDRHRCALAARRHRPLAPRARGDAGGRRADSG